MDSTENVAGSISSISIISSTVVWAGLLICLGAVLGIYATVLFCQLSWQKLQAALAIVFRKLADALDNTKHESQHDSVPDKQVQSLKKRSVCCYCSNRCTKAKSNLSEYGNVTDHAGALSITGGSITCRQSSLSILNLPSELLSNGLNKVSLGSALDKSVTSFPPDLKKKSGFQMEPNKYYKEESTYSCKTESFLGTLSDIIGPDAPVASAPQCNSGMLESATYSMSLRSKQSRVRGGSPDDVFSREHLSGITSVTVATSHTDSFGLQLPSMSHISFENPSYHYDQKEEKLPWSCSPICGSQFQVAFLAAPDVIHPDVDVAIRDGLDALRHDIACCSQNYQSRKCVLAVRCAHVYLYQQTSYVLRPLVDFSLSSIIHIRSYNSGKSEDKPLGNIAVIMFSSCPINCQMQMLVFKVYGIQAKKLASELQAAVELAKANST